MTHWEKLAEARIREWLERPARDRAGGAFAGGPVLPLELQLLEELLELHARTESADATEAAALRRRASNLEIRLLVMLETSGRPLAAQRFAELLTALRRRDADA